MKKPDPIADCDALIFHLGRALGALSRADGPSPEQERETFRALWRLLPLVKAFRGLAEKNPEQAARLYAARLQEPMPLGEPPIGLPKDETDN